MPIHPQNILHSPVHSSECSTKKERKEKNIYIKEIKAFKDKL